MVDCYQVLKAEDMRVYSYSKNHATKHTVRNELKIKDKVVILNDRNILQKTTEVQARCNIVSLNCTIYSLLRFRFKAFEYSKSWLIFSKFSPHKFLGK